MASGDLDGLDAVERLVLSRLGDDYVRCADVVDSPSEYGALIGLAQAFRRRYPLVEGHGNFGSVDGDPPADPPYTEARLAPIARVLPHFPNLLANGPLPHNLREVAAAVIAYIDDPDADLKAHLPGPDFPTGGVIVKTEADAIVLRARSHLEGNAIVVTELPYGVDKGGDDGVFLAIADGEFPEVRDLEDHSDRHSMRIVITLRRDADPQAVLAALHERTKLEITLPVALEPREVIAQFVAGRDPATVRRELQEVADRFGDDRRTTLGQ